MEEIIEAIVLKGLYYLRVLAEYNFNDNNAMIKDLGESLQKMIEPRKSYEFSYVCITIKTAIEKLNSTDKSQKKLPVIPNSRQIQDYYEYFS